MPSINRKTLSFIALFIFLLPGLAACQPGGESWINPTRAAVDIGQVASAQEVTGQFLAAWMDEDYETMYGLLSSLSRDAIPLADFAEQYSDFANTITLQLLEAQVLSAIADGDYAQVAYRAVYHTLLVGDLTREPVMSLVWENRAWRIQWEVGLILPELADGSRLELVYDIPDRGRIFDHNGAPLAGYENAIALGLVPGEILPEQAELVYDTLAEISAFSADELQRRWRARPMIGICRW